MEIARQLAWVRCALRSGEARCIREAAGLSLGDVAAALEVSVATVARWEQGRCPRRDVALRLGELLRALREVAA